MKISFIFLNKYIFFIKITFKNGICLFDWGKKQSKYV